MIVFTPRAGQLVRALQDYYQKRERPAKIRGLVIALESLWQGIAEQPEAGLAAPRPYPQLAQAGRAWVKSGPYWIAYTKAPLAIVAVFYETANIPGRL